MATPDDIHATGVPDTPVEVLTDLLDKALKADDLSGAKAILQKAQAVCAGLDPYLDSISSPPNKVNLRLVTLRRSAFSFEGSLVHKVKRWRQHVA